MLSYRHGFHAGNHADVLKHFILAECLAHIAKKETPFWYIDTHAGAGMYSLESAHAERTMEYREGIALIHGRDDLPPGLARYDGIVRKCNEENELERYPGSPWIASSFLRPGDFAFLHELHTTDSAALKALFEGSKSVRVFEKDGFSALRGYLPPTPRRALVLIDPSYEIAADYDAVFKAVSDALRRFPTGTFAVWYPLLERPEAKALPSALMGIGAASKSRAELTVDSPGKDGRGMFGSGMIVFNPPWTLKATLEGELPLLASLLGRTGKGRAETWWEEKKQGGTMA